MTLYSVLMVCLSFYSITVLVKFIVIGHKNAIPFIECPCIFRKNKYLSIIPIVGWMLSTRIVHSVSAITQFTTLWVCDKALSLIQMAYLINDRSCSESEDSSTSCIEALISRRSVLLKNMKHWLRSLNILYSRKMLLLIGMHRRKNGERSLIYPCQKTFFGKQFLSCQLYLREW